jgi:surface polysaccharide O-acyltransferase-like enzyme
MSSTHQRSRHWDWWKGVAILAVISIHAAGRTSDVPPNSWAHMFGLVYRQAANFAVPLFLCLAGYFAAMSWRGDAVGYWRSRGWRILPAYLVWTTIAISVLRPGDFTSPRALLEDYAFGSGIGIGYYVIVLLQYVALVPLLARLDSTRAHMAVMLVTTLVGLAASYAMRTVFAMESWARFPYYCLPFVVWAPFFHLGFWAGRRQDAVKLRSDPLWLWLAAAAVLAAVVEGVYWNERGTFGLAASQIKATSFLASVFVALHVIATRQRQRAGLMATCLEWIGRSAYLIYLAHMLFLPAITDAIRSAWPTLYALRPVTLLLASALTAMACILVALFVRTVTRPSIHRDLLGAG